MFLKARYLTQRTHEGLLKCIRALDVDIAITDTSPVGHPWKEKKIANGRLGWQSAGWDADQLRKGR